MLFVTYRFTRCKEIGSEAHSNLLRENMLQAMQSFSPYMKIKEMYQASSVEVRSSEKVSMLME